MNRRNFSLALTATVFAGVVLARKRLRQVGSDFFYSIMALRERRARLSERQKRMDAAREDLTVGKIRNAG
jgi:hypothetical protein